MTEGLACATKRSAARKGNAIITLERWRKDAGLASGELLGRCCAAAAVLNGHSVATRDAANLFGRAFGVGYQLKIEADLWLRGDTSAASAYQVLVSAPVVLAAAAAVAAGASPLPVSLTSRAADTNMPLHVDELAVLSTFVERCVVSTCFNFSC
jgi:hypothetical protein